jgi:hypothetical protein
MLSYFCSAAHDKFIYKKKGKFDQLLFYPHLCEQYLEIFLYFLNYDRFFVPTNKYNFYLTQITISLLGKSKANIFVSVCLGSFTEYLL